MASRDPRDLSLSMLPRWVDFDRAMKVASISYILTCTYRSNAEQAILYNQGRTTPGKIVTNAKPGQSPHNPIDEDGNPSAEAFDIVPLVNGRPEWNSTNPIWVRVGKVGEAAGLAWGGRWKTLKDFPHFQNPLWR